MRVLLFSAALLAAAVSNVAAQSPAPAPAPESVNTVALTPKAIAELQSRLRVLDRQMGREWALDMASKRPDIQPARLNDMANDLARKGYLVIMSPLNEKHRQLQVERAEVEAQLLAAGQTVRNRSGVAPKPR